MKISWRWIVFGVVAYLFFLIVTLPAEFVAGRLQSSGVYASGVTGTVWKGQATALQFRSTPLGVVSWDLHTLALFAGKLSANVTTKRDDGSVEGNVSVGFGKHSRITDLKGALPLSALAGFGFPGGWQGQMRLQLSSIELDNNWPVAATGSIDATNLIGPAYQPTALGNFRVEFNERDATSNGLKGKLMSIGDDGPLDVTGTLQLSTNRTYTIEAQVGTRASAPASMAKALQYLGPPDRQGKRPLSVSGSL